MLIAPRPFRENLEFSALNLRRRAPALADDDFALAESAAFVAYINDRWPLGPPLFAHDPRRRAIQRRTARESDPYLAEVGRRFGTGGGSEETLNDLQRELALWDDAAGGDCLTANCRRTILQSIRSSPCCCGSPLAERTSIRNTSLDRGSPPGLIACRRFPSFNGPGRRSGVRPLRLDRARASRGRTERTLREAGRSPTGTSD